ncbi:FAD-dependent oxidoreductase [Clostridium carnis]
MLQYDLVIIGGGAAGLSAGVTALKNGIKKVLILEKNEDLGGNLNLFIHKGFGKYYLNEIVTGPELASFLVRDYKSLNGEFKVNTQVLEVTKDKVIVYVNPNEGMKEIKANAIILATGCREKFTGNIVVPVHKYTGIFTLVSAHRLINLHGFLPGKEVIIVGKNKWALLLARRLLIEGANVKAIIDNSSSGFVSEDETEIIDGFNINIIKNSRIIELYGNERIERVVIQSLDSGEVETVDCDSLILTVGYYPEVDCIRKANIELDEELVPEVVDYETSIKGVYATGTILNGESGFEISGEEGAKVGKIVSDYLKKYVY